MSEKSFAPHTRNEDERKIIRSQRDFSGGMFNDIPASTIPDNGFAYLKNFKNKGNELIGRSGSRRWGDYVNSTPSVTLPTIAKLILYSDNVVNNSRTITIVSGYSFSSDNIGDFFIRNNGINERIINVINESTIVTETEDTVVEGYRNGSLRGQVNGIYYHNVQQKIILHIGTDIYVANDIYVSGWTKAYCESFEKPINEISTFDEKDNVVFIFNRNGIYKLPLDIINGNSYYFYKINSNIPDTKISENFTMDVFKKYGRRYIYSLGKLNVHGQNDTRQVANAKILIDSGTNKIINGVDYTEQWTTDPINRDNTIISSGLTLPLIDGVNKENHWDVFSIWGTTDIGKNGIDPVTGNANNPEQYIWIDDIPIMKCFAITNIDNSNIICTDGTISNKDYFSYIKIYNGSTFDETTIISVDEVNNSFETGVDYTGVSLDGLFAFIGAEKGAKFSRVGKILTVLNGDTFVSSDVGKRIFLSNGLKVYISRYIDSTRIEIIGDGTLPSGTLMGCWNPTDRSYNDYTTDDTLRERLNSYSCYQRFYQPLPISNIGVTTPGFIITSLRDNNYVYYSQTPDGYEYLSGYYHPMYQFTLVKDKVRSLKILSDKLIIYCFNSTSTLDIRSFNEIVLDDIGVSIATLPNQTVVDDTIGVIAYGSIQSLENGNHIMITNEPAIKIFDGKSYTMNTSSKKITEILKRLQPNVSSIYSPLTGYTFWGLE